MTTTQTRSLYSVADHAHPGDIVFFRIDGTVLIPGIQKYQDAPEAMKEAVNVLRLLEEKEVNVVFLTERHGEKEKTVVKTIEQLEALGLKPKTPPKLNLDNLSIAFENPKHRYQHGVIFARSIEGQNHKGIVLKQFLTQLPKPPGRIWVIDDQQAELESITNQNFEGLVLKPTPNLFQFLPHKSIFQGIHPYPKTEDERAKEPETAESSSAPPMPEDLTHMEVLQHLGGGSGGVFVLQDTQTGEKYTLKTATSEEQLSDEIFSDRLYQLAGIHVPSFSVFDSIPRNLAKSIQKKPKGLFRLSKFVEADETLNTPKQQTTNPGILNQFADGFVIDALLGNVDIATHLGNTIVEKNTQLLFRIDNGCGLRHRARGKFKNCASIVQEIDTLRSERSPLGQTLYQNVDEPFLQQKVKGLLEQLPQIIEEIYEMNRVLNINDAPELIQLITDRVIYLKHRFCPDVKLNIPHHPADDYTSASTFIITPNEQGEPCVLLGQHVQHHWYKNLGGKSDREDEDLSETAARETREKSLDLLPLPGQALKECPYHDLLIHDTDGNPSLHRMYMVAYNKEIPLEELQAFATGHSGGPNKYAIEYTDFKLVPLRAIQQALAEEPKDMGEEQPVYLVKIDDGSTLSLHPPLAKMLAQPETKKHLDALVNHTSYQTHQENKGFTLKTPKEITHDIAKQALNKSKLLIEFKQTKAPDIKNRLEEHTIQTPEKLPNEGSSGIHQQTPSYLSQTEIYLQAVLSERFIPNPEQLEENVAYFLNEISEFKNYPEFQNIDNRQQLIEMILKEREAVARGEVVLYHAAETSINFIIDFFTQLRRLLFAEAREDYRAFRATDSFTQAFEHIDELIEHFSKGGQQKIDNYNSFFQELAISCNPFLFGNDGNHTSSSLAIFFQNKSVRPPDIQNLLTKIITTLEMGETETQAVLQLFNTYQKINHHGKLYQICVDKNMIDQISYPAGHVGKHNPLDEEKQLSQILETLSHNPEQHQGYLQTLQARLLLTPKMRSEMHVNEFQNTNPQESSASQTPLMNDIKRVASLLAQKILIQNNTQDTFASRSGIFEQTQMIQKKHGLTPAETINPAIRLINAIRVENIELALKIIQEHPQIDLSNLSYTDNQKIITHADSFSFSFITMIYALKSQTEQQQRFWNVIKNITPLIITSVDYFQTMLQHLNEPAQKELIEMMKPGFHQMIKTSFRFQQICRLLTEQERKELFDLIKPRFLEMIENSLDFKNICSQLKAPEQKELFNLIKPKFLEMIKTGSQFKAIFLLLKEPEQRELFDLMKPGFHLIIQDSQDFKSIFQQLKEPEQRELLQIITAEKILEKLPPEQSILMTNLMPYQKLLTLQQNIDPSFLKRRQDWLNKTDIGHIIVELENYIKQDQNKTIAFFSASSTLNHSANILLAETLRQQLMPNGVPDDTRLQEIFNEESIIETRNNIIKEASLEHEADYNLYSINSTTLNNIIQEARRLVKDPPPEPQLK